MAPIPKEKESVELTEERVKIYAVSVKHKEKPFLATGITDSASKKMLTGQEGLSANELDKLGFVIDANSHYPIRNNDELVLLKKGDVYIKNKDFALYNLYLLQPNVAPTKEQFVKGTHDFYMQNFEVEAKNKISTSKLKAKASAKIVDLNLIEMVNMLYFFGENASSLSTVIAESKVYEYAETRPQAVVDYFNDLDENQKIVFVKKLLSKGFIKRAEASQYLMFEKIVLGANETEAAAFLYDNKNETVYLPLKDMLDKSK